MAETPTDTMLRKVFVGGLPYASTNDTLKEYFSQFGPITEAVVITDKQTGKSKGFGFVTYVNNTDAAKAVANPKPIIEGRQANCNLAYIGAKNKTGMQAPVVVGGVDSAYSMYAQQMTPQAMAEMAAAYQQYASYSMAAAQMYGQWPYYAAQPNAQPYTFSQQPQAYAVPGALNAQQAAQPATQAGSAAYGAAQVQPAYAYPQQTDQTQYQWPQ